MLANIHQKFSFKQISIITLSICLLFFSTTKNSYAEAIKKNESLNYLVKEQWKKDDTFTNSEETVTWSFSPKKTISKETWSNLKDNIQCEFLYKNIKYCEVIDLSKKKEQIKSDRYNPFNLRIELGESSQICQRSYVKDQVSIIDKFTFQKIDIPMDSLERAKNIGEQIGCIAPSKKIIATNDEIKIKGTKEEANIAKKAELERKAKESKDDNKDLFAIQLNTEQVIANKPFDFTVEVKPSNNNLNCGISIATGDGKSQNFYMTDKENSVQYTYLYNKPGNYEVKVDGKTFLKGLKLVLPCAGNKKSMMVTVGENKAEMEQKAKLEEEANIAKKAELEKAKLEEEANIAKKAELERKAKESKDDNKDLFAIQLNTEQVIANKPFDFTVEVKPSNNNLNCGISIATGDGKSQNFYMTDQLKKIRYTYLYNKPGNYEVKVDGKTFLKGLKLVLPCAGNKKSMMVTVGENKAEMEQKAKLEEEANIAKKAELEKAKLEEEANIAKKAELERKAKESKDDNKDLFAIQLNTEQVIANKPFDFTVEVKPSNNNLNCGISIATGDGKSQNFYMTDKENSVQYTYLYNKPGNYEVKVDGKTFLKGLKLVLPCAGNKKSMMVNVGE